MSREQCSSSDSNSSTDIQAVPLIVWNPHFHYGVNNCPPSVSILNHIHVHQNRIMQTYLLQIQNISNWNVTALLQTICLFQV